MMKLSARNKALLPAMVCLIIAAFFFLRFGAIILLLTIVPAMIAYFIDHKEGHPTFKIVAACNIAAALPFIVQIIDFSMKGQFAEAGQVVDDARVWAFIYLGAGVGWAMLYLAKLIARFITLMHYDYKMRILEKKQELLVKEWGEDISTPAASKSKRN